MSPQRLLFLFVPVVLLAVVYAIYTRDWLAEEDARETVASAQMRATAAFVEETFAEPREVDTASAEVPIAQVAPEIRVTEYPGRRLLITGSVSTADERRAVVEAVVADASEIFKIDDQSKLDYRCAEFTWASSVGNIDFSLIKDVRRFELSLSNETVGVSGSVFTAGEAARIGSQLEAVLPAGVNLTNALEAAPVPEASLTVWVAPDSTLLLTGLVPEGGAASWVSVVNEALPGSQVVSDLIEDRFVRPPSWTEDIEAFLPGFLRTVQRASFQVKNGGQVRIEGLAQAEEVDAVQRRVATVFQGGNYELETDLKIGVPTEITLASSSAESGSPSRSPETLEEMLASVKIYFRSGRSRISQLESGEREKIDQLGRLWQRENFQQKVYVFGFTDRSGDPQTNVYFSEARCRNVVNYLRKKYGIDRSYFEVVGTPEDHPEETGTAAELRRVEFSLTEKPSQPPVTRWETASGASAPTRQVLKPVNVAELFAGAREITFGSGEVTPPAANRKALTQLGQVMALEEVTDVVVVYGYSDNKGSAAANQWYTEERCKAVAKELTDAGFPADQVVLRPVMRARAATNETEEGEDEAGDDDAENGEESEGDEEDSPGAGENPRRVELVLMSREAFEATESEVEPESESEAELESEPELETASEGESDEGADGESGGGLVPAPADAADLESESEIEDDWESEGLDDGEGPEDGAGDEALEESPNVINRAVGTGGGEGVRRWRARRGRGA